MDGSLGHPSQSRQNRGVPENYFTEAIAARYDTQNEDRFDPRAIERIVAFLAKRSLGGAALELGIGTGRIALPLSRLGIPVKGIELSEAMLAVLRRKEGSNSIEVTLGDFASASAPGQFRLAYLIDNTIMNLTTQDEQIACFENVARHLEVGGRFVIEVNVPDLQRLPHGERIRPFAANPGRLGFDEYEVATQALVSHHYRLVDGHWEQFSIPFRYVWPSELDLMARLAGLSLEERWGGWEGETFDNESPLHVSVWRRTA